MILNKYILRLLLLPGVIVTAMVLSSCSMYKEPDEVQAYWTKQNRYGNILRYEGAERIKGASFYVAAKVINGEEEERLFSEDLPDGYLVLAVAMRNLRNKTFYYTGQYELFCNGKKLEPVPAYDIVKALYGHFWLTTRMTLCCLIPAGTGTAEIMNEKQRRDNYCHSNILHRAQKPTIIRKKTRYSDFLFFEKPDDYDPKKLELKLTFQSVYAKIEYYTLTIKVDSRNAD